MANTYMTITMMVRTMPVNPERNRKVYLPMCGSRGGGGGRRSGHLPGVEICSLRNTSTDPLEKQLDPWGPISSRGV